MSKRILHVVSNVSHQADPSHPTGLWLSELTHAWRVCCAGFEQHIVSPKGGVSPLEPRAQMAASRRLRQGLAERCERTALLSSTIRRDDVDPARYDAIYFTGGHAVMWDFPDDAGLQRITRTIWEQGGIVSAVCPWLLRPVEHPSIRRSPAGREPADHRLFLGGGNSGRCCEGNALQC